MNYKLLKLLELLKLFKLVLHSRIVEINLSRPLYIYIYIYIYIYVYIYMYLCVCFCINKYIYKLKNVCYSTHICFNLIEHSLCVINSTLLFFID